MKEGIPILLRFGTAGVVLEKVKDRLADRPTVVSDIRLTTENGGCYLRYKVDRMDKQLMHTYICGLVHGLEMGFQIK